ncbi:hypothetical protein HK102_003593 [Quaeritorhiza haematococci]|nr:hypothetical protein HK102_003593 [Quaeritorhiza haematococci]
MAATSMPLVIPTRGNSLSAASTPLSASQQLPHQPLPQSPRQYPPNEVQYQQQRHSPPPQSSPLHQPLSNVPVSSPSSLPYSTAPNMSSFSTSPQLPAQTFGSSPSTMASIRSTVIYALQRADEAVALDDQHQFAEALQQYRETILAIDKVLGRLTEIKIQDSAGDVNGDNTSTESAAPTTPAEAPLTEAEKKRLIEIRNSYIQRVDVLLANLPPDVTVAYRVSQYPSAQRKPSYNTMSLSASRSPPAPPTSLNIDTSTPSLNSSLTTIVNTLKDAATLEAVILEDPSLQQDPLEPPPSQSQPEYRSFWLMRLLAKTMVTGGFLTPRLHVPPQLWRQSGAKFSAVDAKCSSCEVLLVYVNKLRQLEVQETAALMRELEEFENAVDKMRDSLSKKLRFIDDHQGVRSSVQPQQQMQIPQTPTVDSGLSSSFPSSSYAGGSSALLAPPPTPTLSSFPGSSSASLSASSSSSSSRFMSWSSKISKSMEKLNIQKKNEKVENPSAYIDLLVKLFTQSQFMEAWLAHFEATQTIYPNNVILGRLRRISNFFYTVVCAFVMRDFEILLERFLKKMRQAATS